MAEAWKKIRRTVRGALHEIRCKQCRVTWRDWLWRLTGGDYREAKRDRQRTEVTRG